MPKTIKEVLFFSNGVTAVFDESGQQIAKLQKAWFRMYINFLKENGYTSKEIEGVKFTFQNGDRAMYIAKYDNWEFK